jgi:hypothetical protein
MNKKCWRDEMNIYMRSWDNLIMNDLLNIIYYCCIFNIIALLCCLWFNILNYDIK